MQFFLQCVLAIALHEFAHVLIGQSLGVRIKRLGVSWKGPYIIREQGLPSSNLKIALAGPALNLLLAFACWHFDRQFAMINLVLGLSNIVPFVPGTDGQHALAAMKKLRALA